MIKYLIKKYTNFKYLIRKFNKNSVENIYEKFITLIIFFPLVYYILG